MNNYKNEGHRIELVGRPFATAASAECAYIMANELNRLESCLSSQIKRNNELTAGMEALEAENEAMRDVVDVARDVKSDVVTTTPNEVIIPASVWNELVKRLEVLDPPKTIEQLSDEVVSAAIVWDTNPTIATAQALKDASKAWLKLKSEAEMEKQS